MGKQTTTTEFPLRQASAVLFRDHGRQVDPATPYAWAKDGVGGRKLKTRAVNGKLYTTTADLNEFLAFADDFKLNRVGAK